MSIETWKKEFYPIPANEVKEDDAVSHSLQKWTGLLPENLDKHGCYISFGDVTDSGVFFADIDEDSCALCFYYLGDVNITCNDCPIYKKTDKKCGYHLNEWKAWTDESNPAPMIELLKSLK